MESVESIAAKIAHEDLVYLDYSPPVYQQVDRMALERAIASALRAEREKVAAKFAAFAGPDGEPKSVKWPAVAGVSDRDELWEKYICRDDEDAHAVLSLIAFIDYRLQAAAEAAKEKNDA